MIRLFAAAIIATMGVTSYAQDLKALHKKEEERNKLVDTRVDNNGYWIWKASQGLARLNPMVNVPPAVYVGSEIKAFSVVLDDSPDVPVAPSNTTQSENSMATDPDNNMVVLNSNNSSANPLGSFYGADALQSEDGALTWGGTYYGPAGSNSGDPVALIGNNGWFYIGFINNSYGQSVDYSQDGGDTWTRVTIANAPGGGLLDKNHMWVDNSPTSLYDSYMYCAWTYFGGSFDSDIGLARSTDAGLSWSAAVNLSSNVNAGSHNQGVNITTGPDGEVYAVWAVYDDFPTDETAIGMARSLDGGATWDPGQRIITNIRGIRTSGVSNNIDISPVISVTDICCGNRERVHPHIF